MMSKTELRQVFRNRKTFGDLTPPQKKKTQFWIPSAHGRRNRGDREGPSPPGPIDSISWVGPGGTRYITKMGPFTSLGLFFSNCNSCIGGFGPFETLGDPFPRGPQGLVPSTSGIISPALLLHVI